MKDKAVMRREDIELLAPAGDWECLRAAVANGADAVFFGVEKFNARARAHNFQTPELPEIMAYLHKYGVKGFLTFNILVFEDELPEARKLIEACIDAGVDAVIVQDLGLVKMIREISPDFPIHGSTQMTITSPEAVEFTKPFNLERVVLGRENNLKQIRKIGEQARLPMEVFVHGALCVSYSGQCLTSEVWGGRSANRGECAQACRLPYDLMVDGVHQPMGDIAYLLSPKDLAAIDIVPELIEAGVTSFKIEGRLKSPEYVANVVSKYTKEIDKYFAGDESGPAKEEVRELQQSFSRGFTHGFLDGTNNKQLVEGTFPKSRGVYLGKVEKILRDAVVCKLEAPLKRGDGIVFDAGDPTKKEEGGRVYDVRNAGVKLEGEAAEGLRIEIVPGRNDVDLTRLHEGDRIWKTSDPALDRRLRASFETEKPYRTFPLAVSVFGQEGVPLRTIWTDVGKGTTVAVESEIPLERAEKRPLGHEVLSEQLGRLGGTLYFLDQLEVSLKGDVIVPKSELNRMRREAAEKLEAMRELPPRYVKRQVDEFADAFSPADGEDVSVSPGEVKLTALCRTLEQLKAVVKTEVELIYADFEFIKQFPEAIAACREAGKRIALVTPRIHMPGENGYHRNILNLKPDAVLVRNTGALYYYLKDRMEKPGEAHPTLIGDFSLNVANHKTVNLFREAGLDWVTPSYDLNIQQMVDMLRRADTSRLEMVIHQLRVLHVHERRDELYELRPSVRREAGVAAGPDRHVPSGARRRRLPQHGIQRDRAVGCRVSRPVHGAGRSLVPKVREVLTLYRAAIDGKIGGSDVWRKLKATNQLGVTRGQLVK